MEEKVLFSTMKHKYIIKKLNKTMLYLSAEHIITDYEYIPADRAAVAHAEVVMAIPNGKKMFFIDHLSRENEIINYLTVHKILTIIEDNFLENSLLFDARYIAVPKQRLSSQTQPYPWAIIADKDNEEFDVLLPEIVLQYEGLYFET